MKNIIIWILGWYPGNTHRIEKNYKLKITHFPEILWSMTPVGDYFAVSFHICSAPCFIHRWLQNILLGIKYKRFQSDEKNSIHDSP